MPIVSSDIVAYGSATMAEDDVTSGIGGAIDTTTRVVFTDIDPSDTITVVSSDGGDTTQTVTVYGRAASGLLQSEEFSLNGTTPVVGSDTFERVLKIVVSAAHTGTITVTETTGLDTIVDIESGVLTIRRPFYNVYAEESGGSLRDYYEKIFFKNNHATLTLLNATVALSADPTGNVTFVLESSLDGSDDNGDTRLVAPGGYTFNTSTKNVANSQNHTAGTAQGIWVKLSLAAGTAATKSYFTLTESGQTV